MRYARIALLLVVLVALGLAHYFGVFRAFGDPVRLKETLLALGPWGYLAFVGSYTVLQPFGVPGTIYVMAAPLIWPWPVAFALSMVGTMTASIVGFSFARFVARDWVSARIPARFRKYDDALARRGFETVFLLRFIFWMPQALHFFLGISKVRFATHFWGSVAGYAIPLFLVSYFGEAIFDLLKQVPLGAWLGGAAALVAIAVAVRVLKRRREKA